MRCERARLPYGRKIRGVLQPPLRINCMVTLQTGMYIISDSVCLLARFARLCCCCCLHIIMCVALQCFAKHEATAAAEQQQAVYCCSSKPPNKISLPSSWCASRNFDATMKRTILYSPRLVGRGYVYCSGNGEHIYLRHRTSCICVPCLAYRIIPRVSSSSLHIK